MKAACLYIPVQRTNEAGSAMQATSTVTPLPSWKNNHGVVETWPRRAHSFTLGYSDQAIVCTEYVSRLGLVGDLASAVAAGGISGTACVLTPLPPPRLSAHPFPRYDDIGAFREATAKYVWRVERQKAVPVSLKSVQTRSLPSPVKTSDSATSRRRARSRGCLACAACQLPRCG